jgi:transcriptional regulator with XRE-family HTH domain
VNVEDHYRTGTNGRAMTSEVMALMSWPGYGLSMASTPAFPSQGSAPTFGALLREWRTLRRLSQLELSLQSGVSARHLSYVETGKSQPSREMIERLSDTLQMPLRERNALLIAAGYAPTYPERALTTPDLARVRDAIDLILKHQEPYPAYVFNRYLDVVMLNDAAVRFFDFLCGGTRHTNVLHQVFDPNDVRPYIANWEEVASCLIKHLHRAIASTPSDAKARELLDAALAYPDVPTQWRGRELGAAPPLLLVEFCKDGQSLSFFSTVATFGTPREVTLEELHIECDFPADAATAQFCRELAARQ